MCGLVLNKSNFKRQENVSTGTHRMFNYGATVRTGTYLTGTVYLILNDKNKVRNKVWVTGFSM